MGANIRIRNSGVPNYVGEKILVQSNFNLKKIDIMLKDYHDKNLIKFLMYGFPIDHDGSKVTHNKKNHTGASAQFAEHIRSYLEVEKQKGAVMGPFKIPPFEDPVGISPLNSVPKKRITEEKSDSRFIVSQRSGGE